MFKGTYKLRNGVEVGETQVEVSSVILGKTGQVEILYDIWDLKKENLLESKRRIVSPLDKNTFFSADILKQTGKEPFSQALNYLAQLDVFSQFSKVEDAE